MLNKHKNKLESKIEVKRLEVFELFKIALSGRLVSDREKGEV